MRKPIQRSGGVSVAVSLVLGALALLIVASPRTVHAEPEPDRAPASFDATSASAPRDRADGRENGDDERAQPISTEEIAATLPPS